MRTTLIAALLCIAGLVLPCAHAQPSDADRKPFLEYKAKAEQGDAEAQFQLGNCYDSGRGIAKDRVESEKWFRKAAVQNHPHAQYHLGLCYQYGNGVAKNDEEMVKWFRKAADQDEANAQVLLGVCYLGGRGLKQDKAEAVKWFRKAALQGEIRPDAKFYLARCHRNGEGVPKDNVEAFAWLTLGIKEMGVANERGKLEKQMSKEQITAGQKRSEELRAEIEAKSKSKAN